MVTLKSPREVDIMARAGRIVAGTLALMRTLVRPGVSTEDLDAAAEAFIRGHEGATPSFKGLYGFPKTLCTSIDNEIVHGIPVEPAGAGGGEHRERGCRGVPRRPPCRFRHHHSGGPDRARGGAAPERHPAVSRRPASAPRGWGTTWATSGTRCSRWPRGRATASCASWWDTASAPASTRSRRCPTTARPSAARACWKG